MVVRLSGLKNFIRLQSLQRTDLHVMEKIIAASKKFLSAFLFNEIVLSVKTMSSHVEYLTSKLSGTESPPHRRT